MFAKADPISLILASASPIRRIMLEQAGVAVAVVPAAIDEDLDKARTADPAALAVALAEAKAAKVSSERPESFVIGSDSVVSVDGRRFDKPRDCAQAAEHLAFFSGRTMTLTSAVALARAGEVAWSHGESARLTVRTLSDRFIADYLKCEWPAVAGCVGVFRMEGPGVQLFDRVEGSHFTILGMPLIPLLAELRARGELTS